MTPLSLTLKGFRGIRDGLRRDTLTLDIARLTDGAQLIAIVGGNGRGKTTVMENLTPYLTMPSRTSESGTGGFSYYDQICLPEAEKELIWAHEGRSYRTQLVIRANGRRRTEAFLHRLDDNGAWKPLVLDDGTVSDGKIESYERCVESILGSADTFYTSVFAAQGKRQLTTYKNAEIKKLLADLLGLEQIRQEGSKASEIAKLLKAGLQTARQEQVSMQSDLDQTIDTINSLGDTAKRIMLAQRAKSDAQNFIDAEKDKLATALAELAVAQQNEARRTQLQAERDATLTSGKARLATLEELDRREAERLGQLERRIAQRQQEQADKRAALATQRVKLEKILKDRPLIEDAIKALPEHKKRISEQEAQIGVLRQDLDRFKQLRADDKLLTEQIAALEREAGQAALKAKELQNRFGLTGQVPCVGTDLQGQCKLLGDAHQAKTLMPSADADIARINSKRDELVAKHADVRTHLSAFVNPAVALEQAESNLQRLQATLAQLTMQSGRQGELNNALSSLEDIIKQLHALPGSDNQESDAERDEREAIDTTRQQIATQKSTEASVQRKSLDNVDTMLVALPPPFDASRVHTIRKAIDDAQVQFAQADAAFMNALRDQQRQQDSMQRHANIKFKMSRLCECIARIERELGTWSLFAKCMGNDGLIALEIDDAGPTLSGLSNDLLLACYGARFTVEIKTITETGKGEQREGFDIIVHDAEFNDSKSVGQMSGGERRWIDHTMVRAIALYLKMNAGRNYATLFSDEADGPLDLEHKRMFMAMKRETLRLGGYDQEFFISHIPELTAMADTIIDLDAMAISR
jgi:exonuclease SbcC